MKEEARKGVGNEKYQYPTATRRKTEQKIVIT